MDKTPRPAANCIALITLVACAAAFPAHAEKKTVCSITVNSSDEREAFRRHLPAGDYQFVELVERGRPEWLRSACQQKVSCDVLVVSGHFNAGETFYSDKLGNNDFLKIDELERASCSESCPGLFSKLKEVYLFGCESLNPDATKYSSSYGESGRDRMRRIFAGVPVIYGFYSSAPVGPTAAMLLDRYFGSASSAEIGSGRPSQKLLAQFSRNHITTVRGVRESDAEYPYRKQVCQFFDDRPGAAQKVALIHRIMSAGDVRDFFERMEQLYAALPEAERQSPAFIAAMTELTRDTAARSRFLAVARSERQPATRARMVKLGASLGWLSPAEERGELVALMNEVLATRSVGFAEVELACTLNSGLDLDQDLPKVRMPSSAAGKVAPAAVLACLGGTEARGQVIRALASGDDRDVQAAQVYLRHRPISDSRELREVTRDIMRMPPNAAQVRALDTLGRHNIADREILDELARTFATAKSVNVQRAIAEVFIRSDPRALPRAELADMIRQSRIRSPGGGHDLIDVLMTRLGS
jgi:hypothetical protein